MASVVIIFFCQAEDGIRDLVRSRGLGDVYKRQIESQVGLAEQHVHVHVPARGGGHPDTGRAEQDLACLLYTSDAADERSRVDPGGRRLLKKQHREHYWSVLVGRQRRGE